MNLLCFSFAILVETLHRRYNLRILSIQIINYSPDKVPETCYFVTLSLVAADDAAFPPKVIFYAPEAID